MLLPITSAQASKEAIAPAGTVVFSPITDLVLTRKIFSTRADADPYFTRSQAAGLVRSYLVNIDPKNPMASPLHGDLKSLPPIRVHVGNDEVLLDDARRYGRRRGRVDAKLDIWTGMPHDFFTGIGSFKAATAALRETAAFLAEQLESTAK